MTPRLSDLEDVVEGKKLGVEVADGHIIKCPAIGKIKIQMLDDKGNQIEAKLHDVMYVPGLSRRLFSITRFARHGHYAVFKNGTTTLHFSPSWATVTLTTNNSAGAFTAVSPTITTTPITQYHAVLAFRNKDAPEHTKRVPLELLHARLGHRRCRTLLAANEHRLWKDTVIRMSPENGCLSCGIATSRAAAQNNSITQGLTNRENMYS
jgi:hypothetical protein